MLDGEGPRKRGTRSERIALTLLWIAVGFTCFTSESREPTSPPSALPRQLERIAEAAPVVSLLSSPDGDVWVVTQTTATRYGAGDPSRARVALDPVAYRQRFHRDPDPFVAAHVDSGGALWLGSRGGELLVFEGGRWREHSSGLGGPANPIRAILTRGDEIYVGGHGLWRGARTAGPLVPQPPFASARIDHLVSDAAGRVALGAGDRVWTQCGRGWRSVWRGGARDGAIGALAAGPRGELWIGTHDGLVRVGREGRVRRELAHHLIEALAVGPAAALAGTRGSGLFARYAGDWRRVDPSGDFDQARVSAVGAAPGGAFWVALSGRGVFRTGPPTPAAVAATD